MQLPAWQRREVIEDILDISIFSTMNQILKERVNENKDQLNTIDNQIKTAKSNVEIQKKLIGSLVSSKKQQVDQIRKQIADNEEELTANEKSRLAFSNKIDSILASSEDEGDLNQWIASTVKAKTTFAHTKEQTEKNLTFFNENEVCPSCSQNIPHEHKTDIITRLNQDVIEIQSSMSVIEDAYSKLIERQNKFNESSKNILTLSAQCNSLVSANTLLTKQNIKLLKDIENANGDTNNIDEEKNKLKQIADEALILIDDKNRLYQEKQIHDISSILLKDSGIKTAIIKEYLPFMNKFINGYLTAMDFYVHFELDESFNEVIKSRFRDEFTYASFSEGEKMRIDLAILFTWRQIAKMKNSVNTNLLILDEIFDSSLDNSGTDYFLSIMNAIGDKSNVFVISHKGDQLFDKFHSVVKFEKKNDFSSIV
jgi:DNA repair exonuclease SbcCD ATPase subunit